MRVATAMLLAGALGLTGAFLAACGDRSNLIPQTDAGKLKASLDKVAAAVQARDCAGATDALTDLQNQRDKLPEGVDAKLKARIDDGISSLVQRAQEECTKSARTTTQTQTTTTETTPTETQTETTPTETTPQSTPSNTATSTSGDDGGTGGTSPGRGKKQKSPLD